MPRDVPIFKFSTDDEYGNVAGDGLSPEMRAMLDEAFKLSEQAVAMPIQIFSLARKFDDRFKYSFERMIAKAEQDTATNDETSVEFKSRERARECLVVVNARKNSDG